MVVLPEVRNASQSRRSVASSTIIGTSTMLAMKKHVPVRLLKNKFYEEVKALEERCASEEELVELLGHGRAKAGMLEGDLDQGELEIGQAAALVKDIPTVLQLVEKLRAEYKQASFTAIKFS